MALFKRHKLLLGVLLEAPRVPTKTELMKWLFLMREETCLKTDSTFYDFVPYRYGPFSFTVYRDIEQLGRYGYLGGEGYLLQPRLRPKATAAFRSLPTSLQYAVKDILARYSRLSQRRLVDIVYKNHPWFATRSELRTRPKETSNGRLAAYTAGYEGKSIDLFLQKLLRAGIKRVVDVRNNPVSRKYGFSKRTLASLSSELGMDYVHLPALGILPADRSRLESFEDYQKLMSEYERIILPKVPEARAQAARLVREQPSVLVCFEADWRCCHRGRLATAISADTDLEVIHL